MALCLDMIKDCRYCMGIPDEMSAPVLKRGTHGQIHRRLKALVVLNTPASK